MKIALAQMKMEQLMEDNLEKTLHFIDKASEIGANLILFPELQLNCFFPQYSKMNVEKYVINENSSIIKTICDKCKDKHIIAVPNFYYEEREKYYDASMMIDELGNILGVQKMVHIAQADKFYEQDYYEPSDEGFKVFDTNFGKIGIVICFDRHYPESIRTSTLLGADLILIPTANTKDEPMEMFEWEIRTQAFQNSINVAMCNRVGTEEAMDFSGESIVIGPKGQVISKALDNEKLLIADVNLDEAREIRNAKSYCSLRRTEWYL